MGAPGSDGDGSGAMPCIPSRLVSSRLVPSLQGRLARRAAIVDTFLAVVSGVFNDFAVIGQAAGRHQLDVGTQLGDLAHGIADALCQPW